MERGSEVKGFISAAAVGTPGVLKKKKRKKRKMQKRKDRTLLSILKISPAFIMKHIHVGSDTYNPALIFSDVLTRLTSHVKSKQPRHKTQHIIVSTALL